MLDKLTINIAVGKISLGPQNTFTVYNYKDLATLTEKGLIEKQENNSRTSYYVEAIDDGMRFGIIILLEENRINYIRLRWLDSSIKGWDDVSEKAMRDEYHLLSNFVKKKVRARPNSKGLGTRTWHLNWGELEVAYEPRSSDVVISIKPKSRLVANPPTLLSP